MYLDNILIGINQFINFGYIVVWDNLFNVFFVIMVFIFILKMFWIFGYNCKFIEIIVVVINVGLEIVGFSVVFFVMFFVFVFFGFFLFGVYFEGYKSVFVMCSIFVNIFIGKNKFDMLMVVVLKIVQFYYFMYMVCVIMMLLIMFVVILNKSIVEVKVELVEYIDIIGIVDICWKFVKSFFGMFFSFNIRSEDVQNKNENGEFFKCFI